jgi:dTDP-4-dehydrorhamnose 3,5-epimerase
MSGQDPKKVQPAGLRDRPHRDPDGTLLDLGLEGVALHRPPRHVDHRGSLFETINFSHPFWHEPVIHGEWVVSSPGRIKGWGMHKESVDRYVVGAGQLRVVLYDGRVDSPSYGKLAQFHFSGESPGWLRIPTGVWHASQNYGDAEAVFVNFPTEPYDYADPDKYRLDPYDRSQIDFDWALRDG